MREVKLDDTVNAIEVCHIDQLKSVVSDNPNKYCILYITAEWCVVCKRVLPHILQFIKTKNTINIVADYDIAKTIVHKYKVKAIPTLIRFYNNDIDSICMSGSSDAITTFFKEF